MIWGDWEDTKKRARDARQQGRRLGGTPASGKSFHRYNSTDDINFLVTSYATGYEKPDPRIFHEADALAFTLPMSRLEQSSPAEFLGGYPLKAVKVLTKGLGLTRIHVGDDFEKDYRAAKETSRQALHLCRDKENELKNYEISNLLELATFLKLMAEANFPADAVNGR